MAKPTSYRIPQVTGSNKSRLYSRLSRYPAAWLESAADLSNSDAPRPEEGIEWLANQEEDFPGTTRVQFIQDLHRLARIASQQAYLDRQPFGFIARTTTRDLGPEEVSFSFFKVPLADVNIAQSTRKVADRQDHGARVASASSDPELVSAWQSQAQALYYCFDETGAWSGHLIGDTSCGRCSGLTRRHVTAPLPPAGWAPGEPIPEDVR